MLESANYAKYEKMSQKQLLSSLVSLEKKQSALESKKRENQNAIKFIKSKIKKREEKYYTLENSPAIRKITEWEKQHPELAKKIKKELDEEMRSYANNPLK